MPKRILVTYASKSGSTKEVAEYISEKLISSGIDTLVLNVNKVKNVSLFDAVILGTPLRFDKPVHDSISFAQKFANDLKKIPIACFALGVSFKEDSNDTKAELLNKLSPLLSKLPEPFELGFFGGRVSYDKLTWFWKYLAQKDNSSLMDEGDWRNWKEIESWIENIKKFEAFRN